MQIYTLSYDSQGVIMARPVGNAPRFVVARLDDDLPEQALWADDIASRFNQHAALRAVANAVRIALGALDEADNALPCTCESETFCTCAVAEVHKAQHELRTALAALKGGA